MKYVPYVHIALGCGFTLLGLVLALKENGSYALMTCSIGLAYILVARAQQKALDD